MPEGATFNSATLPLASERCRAGHLSGADRHPLAEFPRLESNPALHVAGRANKVILQFDFVQATLARPTQPARAHQLALRTFDGVAVFHARLKRLGLLLLATGLQGGVVLSDHQRPMPLVFAQATIAQRAVMALGAELKTIADFAADLFLQTTGLQATEHHREILFAAVVMYLRPFTLRGEKRSETLVLLGCSSFMCGIAPK